VSERADLVLALRAVLFGRSVSLGWCVPGRASIDSLGASERLGVSRRRLLETAAGRAAARAALRRAGLPEREIARDRGGAPLWPAGIVGSITHTDGLALAAVASEEELAAIGIDLERVRELTPAALEHITSSSERARVRASADPAGDAIALFCAKEAFYKAQYPHTGRVLGFDAVEIVLDPPSARRGFTARVRVGLDPFPRGIELRGAAARAGDHVVAAVAVDRR
jgi:4'-phosphopantetheinyl transferase EntD